VHLVADESCDFSVVIGLRAAGHDVVAITETIRGAEDEPVIELADSRRFAGTTHRHSRGRTDRPVSANHARSESL